MTSQNVKEKPFRQKYFLNHIHTHFLMESDIDAFLKVSLTQNFNIL